MKNNSTIFEKYYSFLGALGPVDGINPELSNLTCSMTYVEPGDIVFLTSDGISDNFDPVVGKFCVPKRTDKPGEFRSPEECENVHTAYHSVEVS